MKGKILLLGCLLMLAAALTLGSAPAQATVFNFDDMHYFTSSGSSAFNARYGVANSGQRSGVCVYQETDPIDPMVITKLGTATGGSIPGEYEVNTPTTTTNYLNLTG